MLSTTGGTAIQIQQTKKSAFEGDFNILPLKPGMITTQVFLLFFASLIYFITLCNFVGRISEGEI